MAATRKSSRNSKATDRNAAIRATSVSGNRTPELKRARFLAITRALSDPTRYQILQHIAAAKSCTCADLRECSRISAATLSHHLKELEAARLITIMRRGKFALPVFRRQVWKTYLAQLGEL